MKSHKQIKDESQTEKKKRKITFAKPKKEKRETEGGLGQKSRAAIKYDHSTAPGLAH